MAVVVLVRGPDKLLHLRNGDVELEGLGEEEVELGHREVTILVKVQGVEFLSQHLRNFTNGDAKIKTDECTTNEHHGARGA